MHGIELKPGANNCYWNIQSKCTNPLITGRETVDGYSRDWRSDRNCTLTILGVHLCSGYKAETPDT